MSEVVKAQSLAELTEILNENDSVVVNFSMSQGCNACMRLLPQFEKVAAQIDSVFVYVDVMSVHEVVDAYGIQSVPTVLHFRKGEPTVTLTGRTSAKLLRELGN